MAKKALQVRSYGNRLKELNGNIVDMTVTEFITANHPQWWAEEGADGHANLCTEADEEAPEITAVVNDNTPNGDFNLTGVEFECFTEEEPAEDGFVGMRPKKYPLPNS